MDRTLPVNPSIRKGSANSITLLPPAFRDMDSVLIVGNGKIQVTMTGVYPPNRKETRRSKTARDFTVQSR